jgi:hypothetical protein
MSKNSVRLSLHRETVRELSADEAALAAGGGTLSIADTLCGGGTTGTRGQHCVGFSTIGCGSC